MLEPSGDLVGRGDLVHAITEFVGAITRPRALLLEGQAGIGKTSLWRLTVALAREGGVRTLTAFPTAAETDLPYSGLTDLLREVDRDEIEGLPEAQRRALDAALVPEVDRSLGEIAQRAVLAATLGVLRHTARRHPVLVAIDDLQWLDEPTLDALRFASRRLGAAPVGLLATVRTGEGEPLASGSLVPPGSLDRIEVPPLTLEEIDAMLSAHLPRRLPPAAVMEVARASGGNPLFARELGMAVSEERIVFRPDRPLDVPTDLRGLVADRLRHVGSETRALLAAVSALSRPTRDLIEEVVPDPERAVRTAIDDGLIRIRGDHLVPAHPLFGSVSLAEIPTEARRSLHRRAAAAVTDPEERAHHSALATEPPDEEVARRLEEAGRHAEGRGAPGVGAALLERAAAYGPPDDDEARLMRIWGAARCFFKAGHAARAVELFEEAAALCPPGDRRATIRFERSLIEDLPLDRHLALRTEILEEARDPHLRARAHCLTAWDLIATYRQEPAAAQVSEARRVADDIGDEWLSACALGLEATLRFFGGEGTPLDLGARSLELERSSGTVSSAEFAPRYRWAVICLWADRLEESRTLFLLLRRDAAAEGNEPTVALLEWFLTVLECRAGDWDAASRYAASSDRTWETLHEEPGVARAIVAAHRGLPEEASAALTAGLRAAEEAGRPFDVIIDRSCLGLAALAAGEHEAVIEHLAPLPRLVDELGIREPGHFRFHADLVEALVAGGAPDEAARVAEHLEALAVPSGRESSLAAAARCRGWIAVADGRLEEGLRLLEDSARSHRALGQPFELARTLLLLGTTQRRARMWGAARGSLDEARSVFQALGAPPWLSRSERELQKIGGRAASPVDLTPAEEQTAALAALGRTNREIAQELYVSVKTVEWTLSKVYRKLQIRSRTELAARLPPGDDPR